MLRATFLILSTDQPSPSLKLNYSNRSATYFLEHSSPAQTAFFGNYNKDDEDLKQLETMCWLVLGV